MTQSNCGLCDDAKALLDRLAVEYSLTVSTVDVATAEGEAIATGAGILFPPGLILDGEPFSYGRVSERKLREELVRRLGD